MNETSAPRSRTAARTVPLPADVVGKLPPQAVELEEAVLGAMMLEQQAVNAVIDVLRPESFYREAHQRVFEASPSSSTPRSRSTCSRSAPG